MAGAVRSGHLREIRTITCTEWRTRKKRDPSKKERAGGVKAPGKGNQGVHYSSVCSRRAFGARAKLVGESSKNQQDWNERFLVRKSRNSSGGSISRMQREREREIPEESTPTTIRVV